MNSLAAEADATDRSSSSRESQSVVTPLRLAETAYAAQEAASASYAYWLARRRSFSGTVASENEPLPADLPTFAF